MAAVENCADLCVEFCRRDDLACPEAGKVIVLIDHTVNYRIWSNDYDNVLLVFNSALEATEPHSAHRHLCKISSDFKHELPYFVDVFLTKRLAINKITIKSLLAFGRVSQVTAGYKTSTDKNYLKYSSMQDVWVPVWTSQIPKPSENNSNRHASLTLLLSETLEATCDVLRLGIDVLPEVEAAYNICRARLILRPCYGRHTAKLPSIPTGAKSVMTTVKDSSAVDPSPVKRAKLAESNSNRKGFLDCPDDIILYLVDMLPLKDRFETIVALSLTCRRFYDIFRRACPFTTLDFNLSTLFSTFPSLMAFLAERSHSLRHVRISRLPHLKIVGRLERFLAKVPPVLLSFVAEHSPVTDKVVEIVAKTQPQLELLSLSGCHNLSRSVFDAITNLEHLRYLRLDDVNVGPKSLGVIGRNCRSLQHLIVRKLWTPAVVTQQGDDAIALDSAFSELAKTIGSTSLRSVCVDSTCFSDVFRLAKFIASCRHLEELYIESFPKSSISRHNQVQICQVIAENCPNLRDLLVGTSHRHFSITSTDFMAIKKLDKLDRLRIENVDISTLDISLLLYSTVISKLALSGTNISGDDLEKLRKEFPARRIDYFLRTQDHIDLDDDDDSDDSDDGNGGDHFYMPGDGGIGEVQLDVSNKVSRLPRCSSCEENNADGSNNNNNNKRNGAAVSSLSAHEYNVNVAQQIQNDVWIYHVNDYCKRREAAVVPNQLDLNEYLLTSDISSVFDSEADEIIL